MGNLKVNSLARDGLDSGGQREWVDRLDGKEWENGFAGGD